MSVDLGCILADKAEELGSDWLARLFQSCLAASQESDHDRAILLLGAGATASRRVGDSYSSFDSGDPGEVLLNAGRDEEALRPLSQAALRGSDVIANHDPRSFPPLVCRPRRTVRRAPTSASWRRPATCSFGSRSLCRGLHSATGELWGDLELAALSLAAGDLDLAVAYSTQVGRGFAATCRRGLLTAPRS